jgi:ABC-type uncharacterized transport system permease subunit
MAGSGQGFLSRIWVELAAIALAFGMGFLLVGAFGFNPFEVYGVLLNGAAGSLENVAWSLQNATPLIFTGLATALAFRVGLFNIGAEGQLVAGAFCAAVVGWAVPVLAKTDLAAQHFWDNIWYPSGRWYIVVVFVGLILRLLWLAFEGPRMRPPAEPVGIVARRYGAVFVIILALWAGFPLVGQSLLKVADYFVFPLALLAAAVGGALFAAIPAYLRAHLGVSEVINTIMFNFIAAFLASYLLTTATFKDPGSSPQTPAVVEAAKLSQVAVYVPQGSVHRDLAATRLNTGFVMALLMTMAVGFLLAHTTVGFEFRAVGANPHAAQAQGISVERTIMRAFMLSGALAGLGGAEQVLGVHHHFVKDFWTGLGFTGIAVALVGRNAPWGVVAAALLFGGLQNGAVEIDMMTLFPRELILVLQGLIIFMVTSGPVLADLVRRRFK